MTPLTPQESRALAFIAGLVFLSVAARVLDRPRPLPDGLPDVDVQALEAASRAALEGGGGRAPLEPGERIDPNTAPLDELLRLPRMTRAIADRIVERRTASPFRSMADLDRVQGVGPATLDGWREWIALPETAASPEQSSTRASARGRTADGGAGSRTGAAGSAETSSPAMPIDVNRATQTELERLPGIGPALATRIIAYRDSVGRFERIDQLERVRGIGPAMLARLRDLVTTGS